jgi:hypothetical protein
MDIVTPVIAATIEHFALWLISAAKDEPRFSTLTPDAFMEIEDRDSKGEIAGLLSAEQAHDIGAFLEHPGARRLVELNTLWHICSNTTVFERLKTNQESLAEGFETLATNWCQEGGTEWSSLAPEIWLKISERTTQGLTPLPPGDEESAEALAEAFLFGRLDKNTVPPNLAELLELVKDPKAAAGLRAVISRARRYWIEREDSTFEVHGNESRADFSRLYIDRTVTDTATGQSQRTADVFDDHTQPFRVTIIGDPGTGKSTLVRWIEWRGAIATHDRARIPLTIRARIHLAERGSLLLDGAARAFTESYGEPLSVEQLRLLLAAGSLLLIVDGIDEITNTDQRKSIVESLKHIARGYPHIQILCTTRRTGFEVGLLQNSQFAVLLLDQYDEHQTQDYVSRWFDMHGDSARASRFLGESRNLPDLTKNPLMLALLCALYSQQDYIPQSRREVYLRCASLMFREWDPRRGIAIPNIFKRRGDQVLQAIASNIDRKGGYGYSIEEPQLERIVRGVLERAGLDLTEAHSSAREFIAHCTGRAWILSAREATNGVRRLGFTHRTFYEFYYAEAQVREINRRNAIGAPQPSPDSLNMSPLARAVVEPFWNDPTSVVPELIIQAADDLMGDISESVLGELIRVSRHQGKERASDYVALAVRLLSAAGANAAAAKNVLEELAKTWKLPHVLSSASNAYGMSAFRSLLDIASGHRAIFGEMLESDRALAFEFLRRYTRLAASQQTGMYSAFWGDVATQFVHIPASGDRFVAWYQVSNGARSAMDVIRESEGLDAFSLALDGTSRAGAFWYWVASQKDGPPASPAFWKRLSVELLSVWGSRPTPTIVPFEATRIVDAQSVSIDPRFAVLLSLTSGGGEDQFLGQLGDLTTLPAGCASLRAIRDSLLRLDENGELDGDSVSDALARASNASKLMFGTTRLSRPITNYLTHGLVLDAD